MNNGRVTPEHDITDHMMTLRDSLLAAKAEGKDLDDVIKDMNRAIRQRLLREKRESAA